MSLPDPAVRQAFFIVDNMKRGFTKSYRKELDSDIWLMPPLYHRVWFYLRSKARWEKQLFPTRKKFGIWLNPGQLITSIDLLAYGVQWTEWGKEKKPNKKTIKTILQWLESNGMILVESNATGTYINIINWHIYNDIESKKVTEKDRSNETENKRLLDTIKELKEVINKLKSNTPPVKSKKDFLSDSEEYRLSLLLLKKIKERDPKHKDPNIQTWSSHVEKLIRINKRDPQTIANVINWCQKDQFWQNNILSTEKLRKQFDKLILKMNGENGNSGSQPRQDNSWFEDVYGLPWERRHEVKGYKGK